MERNCIIEHNAIRYITEFVKEHSAKCAFIVGDTNTYPLAGDKICAFLKEVGVDFASYQFKAGIVEPDEVAVGSLLLNYDSACDVIIGIGSGVINDLCKLLASVTKNPYVIVGTAPSMDGYASPLSSMVRDGLKVSVPTKKADLILADLDILKTAPLNMLKSGLGDMMAKYVSICEWRIGALITGEYFDEEIANSVRVALRRCVENADGLLKYEDEALKSVFEGLVLTGEAMEKAGVSRPASGAEHYFSHLWDMRGLEFGTPVNSHGIQCGIATRFCIKLYYRMKNTIPDKNKALNYVENFDRDKWNETLREFLGRASEPLISLEDREGKYDVEKHRERLNLIINKFDDILAIIDEELPAIEFLDELYNKLELPVIPPQKEVVAMTIKAGKDIRDKYVLPRLLWDLGVLDEFADSIDV